MVLPIKISQNARDKLGFVICIVCAILAACGAVVIGLGVYMQIHINDQLLLLESYNSGMLPHFLISVGTVMILLNVVSAKIGLDAGCADTSERIRMVLVPLLVILALFCIVIMVAGIVCLTSRTSIEEALHNGLKDSMNRYKNNLNVKVAVDKLQMRSHCCGSRSFKDWFNVGWINTDYVNKKSPFVQRKMKDGDVYVDSVPFSCCSVHTYRPCTSHQLAKESLYALFDLRTLYQVGCTDKLMDELENKLLYPTGTFVHAMFGLQVLVTVLLRYLQTSVQNAYEEGDIEGTGKGFCIPNTCPAGCCPGDPDKYVRAGALHASRDDDLSDKEEVDDRISEEAQSEDTKDSLIGQAQEDVDRMDQVQDFEDGGGGSGGSELHASRDDDLSDKEEVYDSIIKEAQSEDTEDSLIGQAQEDVDRIDQVQDFEDGGGGSGGSESQGGDDNHKDKNSSNKMDRSSAKSEKDRSQSKSLKLKVTPKSAKKYTKSTGNKPKRQKSPNKMDSTKRRGGVGRKLGGRKR